MKRQLLFVAVLVLSLAGCATRVPIQRLVPAVHDMGAYRFLEVRPTLPFSHSILERPVGSVADLSGQSPVVVYTGYQAFDERQLADHIGEALVRELSANGYFSLIEDQQAGATGLLQTRVSRMGLAEYVYARKVADEVYQYHLRQQIDLAISFEVIDAKSRQVYMTDSVHARDERTFALDPQEDVVVFAPWLLPWYQDLADTLVDRIVASLAPRRVTTHVSLMTDTSAGADFDAALEAASDGEHARAYHLFLALAEGGQESALYNAALLAESLGRRDEAMLLMGRLAGHERAQKQLQRMERYQQEESRARAQY